MCRFVIAYNSGYCLTLSSDPSWMPSRKLWKGGEETSWQRCKTGPACPWDLTREKISPDFQKASTDKAVNSGKESFAWQAFPRKASKNHPLLNHPLWLVVGSLLALSPKADHSESLCKRISCIVAQTIVRQLSSVVKTSI